MDILDGQEQIIKKTHSLLGVSSSITHKPYYITLKVNVRAPGGDPNP